MWYNCLAVENIDKIEKRYTQMKNANFKKTLLVKTPYADTYGIENYKGMTKEEILDACDPNNFGGTVHGNIVKVNID